MGGYCLEIRATGRTRKKEELLYMTKEYVFSCCGWFFFCLWSLLWRVCVESRYTSDEVAPMNWWNLGIVVLQVVACFFWLDSVSFWIHYVAHIKWPINIYAISHHFHHLFREPSAFCLLAIDPIEIMLNVVMLRWIIILVPVEFWVLDLTLLINIAFSFLGHFTELGLIARGTGYVKLAQTLHLNTTEKHRLHHLYVRCNYSVMAFNYWDVLLGTEKTSKSSKTG